MKIRNFGLVLTLIMGISGSILTARGGGGHGGGGHHEGYHHGGYGHGGYYHGGGYWRNGAWVPGVVGGLALGTAIGAAANEPGYYERDVEYENQPIIVENDEDNDNDDE